MQDLHQTGCSRPAWSWGAAGLLPTPSLWNLVGLPAQT